MCTLPFSKSIRLVRFDLCPLTCLILPQVPWNPWQTGGKFHQSSINHSSFVIRFPLRLFKNPFEVRNLGAFFAALPQKTGLFAPSPRICSCKSCGLSAAIPCAAAAQDKARQLPGRGIAVGNSAALTRRSQFGTNCVMCHQARRAAERTYLSPTGCRTQGFRKILNRL
jgi:hypothetical protein